MFASRIATLASVLAGLNGLAGAVTCYSGVNIFTARGTGEVPATGLGIEGVHINAILSAIPGSNATVVDYPASFANNSISIGVLNGTSEIEEYLDACPTSKIVVMGYSQGAAVQGFVLTGTTLAVAPDGSAQTIVVPPLATKYANQIVAIVFFGDPLFNKDIGVNSDAPYPCNTSAETPRTGALWESYGPRLEEWCNYSDYVCCATGSTFDGHISYFSGDNGTITANFVKGKYVAAIGSGGSGSGSSVSSGRPASVSSAKSSVTRVASGTTTASLSVSKTPSVVVPSVKTTTATPASPSGFSTILTPVSSESTASSVPTPGSSASKGSSTTPGTTPATTSKSKITTLPTFPTLTLPSLTVPRLTLPTKWY